MVQKVTEETSMILAGSFPRRRDGGTHPLPTLGASGSRRSPQGWEGAGAWVKAQRVYLIERKAAGRSMAAVCAQAVGFGAGALLSALPAPQCSLPLCAALLHGQSQTVCTCLWGLVMLGVGG